MAEEKKQEEGKEKKVEQRPAKAPQAQPQQKSAQAQGGARKDAKAPGGAGAAAASQKQQIIRFLGRDVDGSLSVKDALRKVKGLGHALSKSLSRAVEKKLGLKSNARVGELSEQQIEEIESIARSPSAHGVKWFQLNRAHDPDTGESKHLLGTDLVFATKQDISRGQTMRSWKGWRHAMGQKVRGQHTRTTGRSGMTVGVLKKAVKAQKVAAAAAAQEKGEKTEKPSEKK